VTTDKDGNLVFKAVFKEQNETFLFTKENYDKHCKKHSRLKFDKYLEEIEKALMDPDRVTKGPNEGKRTFYKVVKIINPKFNTYVEVWQVPTFNKGKLFNIISTAYTFWSPSWRVIHHLEEKIWEKENSLI